MRLRDGTGVGQHIDIAMLDTMLVTDDQLHYDLEDSRDTAPQLSEIWPTGAGAVLIAGDFRHVWRQLAARMGVADPTPAGASLDEKIHLRREAAAAFFAGLKTSDAVRDAMEAMNLAWGDVRSSADVRESPTVRHRGSIADVDDRAGGKRPITQSPYRFSNARAGVRGVAPHRGEHNADVLADWLGCSAEDVAQWRDAGALLEERAMSRIGIGIDFGTTNSAAAVFDGERVALAALGWRPGRRYRLGARRRDHAVGDLYRSRPADVYRT